MSFSPPPQKEKGRTFDFNNDVMGTNKLHTIDLGRIVLDTIMRKSIKGFPYIDSSPVPEYNRIRTLNGYKIGTKLKAYYKYMSFRRFDESTGTDKNDDDLREYLAFVTPAKWIDPFESLYYNADFSSHNYHAHPIACLCVTGHPYTNEEASWRAYTRKGEKAIRVGYDIDKLLTLLNDYANKNNCTIYIGKVNYNLDKKEIIALAKANEQNDLHQFYFPSHMGIEHYLSLMLLKRKAFQYENEIRFFIVRNDGGTFDNVVKIPCDYRSTNIITKVTIEPLLPLRSNDIEDKIKHEGAKRENKLIIKHIKDKLGCVVERSTLYAKTAPISIE